MATLEDRRQFGDWHESLKKSLVKQIESHLQTRINAYQESIRNEAPAKILTSLLAKCKGGKMNRAAFVELGYLAAGGGQVDNIRSLQAAVEILHTAVLVHDDIIDRSEVRHGGATLHRSFAQALPASSPMCAQHYGLSMAILAGDVGVFTAMDLAVRSEIPRDARLPTIELFMNSILETAIGEVLDVEIAASCDPREEHVSQMTRLKTTNYTVLTPLQLGELAATGQMTKTMAFRGFASVLGTAYQLHDDYLGLYGKQSMTQKPELSDIREGKKTLLWHRATHHPELSNYQATEIKRIYGSPNANADDLKIIREIFSDLGIDEWVKAEVEDRVAKAELTVSALTSSERVQSLLLGMCDSVRIMDVPRTV